MQIKYRAAAAVIAATVSFAAAAKDANTIYNECLTGARNWRANQLSNCAGRAERSITPCKAGVESQYEEKQGGCLTTLNASTEGAAIRARQNATAAQLRAAKTPPRPTPPSRQ